MRTELEAGSRSTRSSLLLLGFVLLLLVFVPASACASTARGAGSTSAVADFQSVEAVKLHLIVWLASYLVRHPRRGADATFRRMIKPLGVASAWSALLLLQPDFGSLDAGASRSPSAWSGSAARACRSIPCLVVLPLMPVFASWRRSGESYRVQAA